MNAYIFLGQKKRECCFERKKRLTSECSSRKLQKGLKTPHNIWMKGRKWFQNRLVLSSCWNLPYWESYTLSKGSEGGKSCTLSLQEMKLHGLVPNLNFNNLNWIRSEWIIWFIKREQTTGLKRYFIMVLGKLNSISILLKIRHLSHNPTMFQQETNLVGLRV